MKIIKKSSITETVNKSHVTTVPKVIVELLGLEHKDKLEWILKDGELTIKPIKL